MIIRIKVLTSIFCILMAGYAVGQNFSGSLKADQFFKRISSPDTIYVVNFWATWCKPCVEELPIFDSLSTEVQKQPIKVLLVNLDFIEKQRKVKDFLRTKKITTECVLLDEINGNDYIDRVSPNWTGAIPATLIIKGTQKTLLDHKLNFTQLNSSLERFKNNLSTQPR